MLKYLGIASDLHSEVPIWSPLISDYPAIGNYDLSKIISPPYGDPENPLTFYFDMNDMPTFFTYNTYGSDELRIDVCIQSLVVGLYKYDSTTL
jgi:hypothetical protein